ncbi:MAG: YdcF family protein [Tatlockia sp.]|nr:YdcF family protein [Tatlockia sp.]
MSLILRHLFEAILNPFFCILFIFAILLALLWRYGTNLTIRIGFTLVFILLVFCSSGVVVSKVTRQLESNYPVISQVDPSVHWVVVLSGGQANLTHLPANNLLNGVSIKRLVEGLRLFRQLPDAKLLLTGGGFDEVPEAIHLSELTAWFAISPSKIVLETQSINTLDQAKALKKLVHNQPFYLVTSAIHMPRSVCLCQAYGLKPIPAPTDFTLYWNAKDWPIRYLPNAHNLFYLSLAMHEILGRAWTKIQGEC